jgi:hypothetical protein
MSKKTHVKKIKHALFQDYMWIIDTYIIFVLLQFTDVFFLELQGEVIFRLVLFLQIPTQRWRNILWLVVMSVVVSEVILFKSLCDSVVSLWSKPKPSWKITWVLGLMSFRNRTYYIKGFPRWVKTWNDVRVDAFTIGVAMVAVAHFSHKVDSCVSVSLLCTFALCAQKKAFRDDCFVQLSVSTLEALDIFWWNLVWTFYLWRLTKLELFTFQIFKILKLWNKRMTSRT